MMPEYLSSADLISLQYITPRNVGGTTKYPTDLGPNQVCTLVGSTPGTAAVTGAQYIAGNFEYDVANQWRNL